MAVILIMIVIEDVNVAMVAFILRTMAMFMRITNMTKIVTMVMNVSV